MTIGRPIRRVEDPAILTGNSAYVADIELGDTLHCRIVRSSIARGEITSIDTEEALALPGVMAVLTAADLGELNGPLAQPTWFPPNEALAESIDVATRQEYVHLLAPGQVRYVGEPIAIVVATDAYVAEDAARLVFVDYEAQPPVTGIEDSRELIGGVLNNDWPDNVTARFEITKGDVEHAFDTADTVVRGSFATGRQTGTPIEPRGLVVDPAEDLLTVWSSNQAPHWLRNALADHLGMDHEGLRVVAPDVGGGFGIKSMVYPEELLIPTVATKLGRRLKWIETRTENFLAAVHSRDQRHEIELALAADGTILGLRDHFTVDCGAVNLENLVVPYNTAAHLQGSYKVPAASISCECLLTNKAPLSAYRGAGRPEAVFAMERILDRAAVELGMDPAEIRRINLLSASDMPHEVGIPYRDGSALVLDGGDYRAVFEAALEHAEVPKWREEQLRAREAGRLIGVGFSNYVEGTGIGPGETARVVMDSDGSVQVHVALPSQGQGHATSLAQVAADRIGVEMDSVSVHQGDTHSIPDGGGTIASRTAVVAGSAVARAAELLRDKIFQSAAELLEADPSDLRIVANRVEVEGAASRSVALDEITEASTGSQHLDAIAEFTPERVTFAYGSHVAIVEVEPTTGHVEILSYVIVHDCGKLLNPIIVDGQVAGGTAQGIGGALLEELTYDESGQLTTASFLDYQIPRITDLPDVAIHHFETASDLNPLGVRGVGEAGTIAPPAALAGAVDDALGVPERPITRCPFPPAYIAALIDPSVSS